MDKIRKLAAELVDVITSADACGDEHIAISDVIETATHLGVALEESK